MFSFLGTCVTSHIIAAQTRQTCVTEMVKITNLTGWEKDVQMGGFSSLSVEKIYVYKLGLSCAKLRNSLLFYSQTCTQLLAVIRGAILNLDSNKGPLIPYHPR